MNSDRRTKITEIVDLYGKDNILPLTSDEQCSISLRSYFFCDPSLLFVKIELEKYSLDYV